MKKKQTKGQADSFSWVKKGLLIMRLSLFLMVLGILQSAASVYSQNWRFSFDERNITVKEVLARIESQSDFRFFYEEEKLNVEDKINIKLENKTITEVLNQLFCDAGVDYKILDNNFIVLKPTSEKNIDLNGQQQGKVITGKVADTGGIPLPGVSVVVKGTTNGTITDADGTYSLTKIPEGSSLIFSFVGMKNQEVSVDNKTIIDVVLQEETFGIEEVVAIGYGTLKRKDLTGSISSVKMNEVENKEAISLADYLMGSIAGLNITRSSSTSGQTAMQIRGQNSISASTEPLLVVDGIIYDGKMNDINPSDIETIDVLKDASSAAVYGAKAAAGVVIITTKKGKSEKPVITVDSKWGIQKLIRTEKTYNVEGYLKMRSDAMNEYEPKDSQPGYYTNPNSLPRGVDLTTWLGYDGNYSTDFDPEDYWLQRLNLYAVEMANHKAGKSVDWYNEVFKTGIMQDHNVSMSGVTNKINYYWSVGYLKNNGVVYNDSYSNLRSRLNLDGQITDYLQVGLKVNFSEYDNGEQPATWDDVFSASPLGDKYNSDGTYTKYPNGDAMGTNPFDATSYSRDNGGSSLFTTIFSKIKLPFGVTYEMNFSNRWGWSHNYVYKPISSIAGGKVTGYGYRADARSMKWSVDNILRWEHIFADVHRFNVTLLYNAEKYKYFQTEASATDFSLSELLAYHALDIGGVYNSNSDDEADAAAAMMGRLNYGYKNKYLLTASFRRDGYSAFGQNHPWANFPSLALAWSINEENFIKKISQITNLKLRLSYGINGNREVGRYEALSQLTSEQYIVGGTTVTGLYSRNMANPNLKWEKTTAYNLGLDFGLFHGCINGSMEFYKMQTKDLLLTRALPTLTGYESVISNMGQLDNKGAEFTLNSINVDHPNFKWESSFNFSMNRNKIVHLYGDMVNILDEEGNIIGQEEGDDSENGRYIGHALDAVYGYKVIGVWQEEEKEEAAKYGKFPGDFKVLDKNGDKQFAPDDDKEWQGYTKPRYRFNLRNNLTIYKSINISFQLRANVGHIKNATDYVQSSLYTQRVSDYVRPYWTAENRSNTYSRVRPTTIGANVYRNASFLRIDDFSIGYKFPPELLKKVSIQNARVYLNIDNVWSFDNWMRWDPETVAPTPTVFTLGINLTL